MLRANPLTVLMLLAVSACGTSTTLPGNPTGDTGAAFDEAVEVCGAATSAEDCRSLSTDRFDCGAVISAECDADPYSGDTDWRFDDCVPSNITCTQFTIWLETPEGCRAFDACYAPSDEYPSCDPDVACP